MGLAEVVDELYGLDASEFVAARDARAKRARSEGDRTLAGEVKALKRPAAAAWVVNILVRQRADEVERLMTFGESFRQAQANLAGDELRSLGRQRHQVLGALGREARALAEERGTSVSEAVQREVESTLDAAVTDEDAAEAVRTGRLLRSLRHAGMGPVDLDGALAAPAIAVPARRATAGPAEVGRRPPVDDKLAAARAAVEEAEADLERAEHAVSSAHGAVDEAERRRQDAEERARALEEQLERAQARVRTAVGAIGGAAQDLKEARKAVASVRRRADRARAQLGRLE